MNSIVWSNTKCQIVENPGFELLMCINTKKKEKENKR